MAILDMHSVQNAKFLEAFLKLLGEILACMAFLEPVIELVVDSIRIIK